ncbi:Ubiquitin carboxyl-terminal hydrolase isozyme L3 [Ceratocystis lukuohia]|uniref:Ubiquitin carboxyl-terminal hydrolase n=3 Tax=Ceratocystis TaxID=5157 RepID=A0A0F8CUP7_CERFI|nr:Ubiquitin carboxyl-terminal hydrolase isozyme L3 [Ceratocystis platani]PHH50662.1 Ubiquitin carboxyl-terminal hydrolase isozyme L3 [Ceratocystis fimbriata CBS 114723]
MASTTPNALSFVPLEANPELLTAMLHHLGMQKSLAAHDVWSLTDDEMLNFVPRPALALLLVFPVSATYEQHRQAEDADKDLYNESGDDQVLWFPQTIRNSCGLMGLLHAVSNGPARSLINPDSILDKILKQAIPLQARERASILETSKDLAVIHARAADKGATAAPEASEDVDLHYVCFVKGNDGTLWELDGRRKGPLERGHLSSDEDVLSRAALENGPLKFLQAESKDLRFSCIILAE